MGGVFEIVSQLLEEMESGVSIHWQRQSEQRRDWPLSAVPCLWILGPKRKAQSRCIILKKPKTEARRVKTFEEKIASQLMYHTFSCIKRLWGMARLKIRKDRTKCKANTGVPKQKVALTGAITLHLKLKQKEVMCRVLSSLAEELHRGLASTRSCDGNHTA